ncbi:MAG: oligoendopeptidase F [Clostridia bacterium]|nr:oligoendopeptidase F [Clostridia bacterium]
MIFERDKVEAKYKWKLEDIFATDDAWEECYFATDERIPHLAQYQDKLKDDDNIFDCLELTTRLTHDIMRLLCYARMRHDEDAKVEKYQALADRVQMLIVKYSSVASFITPELCELSKERLEELKNKKRFKNYSVEFEKLIRDKEIVLSKKEEKLLSEMQIFADTNEEVYSMFDNADIKFTPVEDENGEKIELSHGMYGLLLQNPNQGVRARAFDSMFTAYKDHINMIAANYAGNVKKDWFFAKVRGFKSALDYSMYRENVPPTCYRKLLEAVDKGTAPLHRYIALRKKVLGLDTLNMYDLYLPIVKEQKVAMPYPDAVKTVKEALSVMGKDYQETLASAFEDGWVDVYENKGKRSGAYSWGCYGVHPFVLLNYQETVHDVFTIAHELGHAMHSFYSNSNQPEQKAGYEIFVAEIASTVNEVLLLKHLLKTATGELRKYLLSYYLDMFRTTLFRQTMFSEFEVIAHTKVENGEPITADNLCAEYLALNKKYYGEAVEHNDLIKYEWARIPHFYSSYYVYKYATGITTAVSIASNILEKGEAYFDKYRQFLSAGGSMAPLDIIRLADVDLETDAPYEKAMKEFADTLLELEKSFE